MRPLNHLFNFNSSPDLKTLSVASMEAILMFENQQTKFAPHISIGMNWYL